MNEFNNILPLLKELPSKAEENPIPEGLEKWLPKVELLGKIYSEAATKKEESNLFSTNNRYIKPTDLNFNFVDNRKICSCCSSNYCMYEYLPQNNIEYQKVCLSVDCNIERMYMHWKKMGSSEEQMHRDLESFKGYLSKTYTGFQYSQLYSYALVKLQLTQQLQDYANVVGAITGEKMTGLGGLKRDVNLFETKSKYCGNRCANDYRCQ